jgi:hypothetical protein
MKHKKFLVRANFLPKYEISNGMCVNPIVSQAMINARIAKRDIPFLKSSPPIM